MNRFSPWLRLSTVPRQWGLVAVCVTLSALAGVVFLAAASRDTGREELGALETDFQSQYSHIRVRRKGNVRTLIFVRDSGEEAMESQMDLAHPHELRFVYLKYMFTSYAFRPMQEKVLIVGLGGGSMIHFLERYDPAVKVEAVEIDPAVVRVAADYFGVRGKPAGTTKGSTGQSVNIVTADGLDFLAKTEQKYDVIYMDAFLKPTEATDSTGVPLKLRTHEFYKDVQKKLTPDGLVVFNLNPQRNLETNIKTIRDIFPQVYVFALPSGLGRVVVASTGKQRIAKTDLVKNAKLIDRRFNASFSFQDLLRSLQP